MRASVRLARLVSYLVSFSLVVETRRPIASWMSRLIDKGLGFRLQGLGSCFRFQGQVSGFRV